MILNMVVVFAEKHGSESGSAESPKTVSKD